MNGNARVCLVLAMLVAVAFATSVAEAALVMDDFNRPNNDIVGNTTGGTAGIKTWAEDEPLASSNRIDVNGTRLVQGYYSPSPSNGVAVGGFTIADGIIEVTSYSVRNTSSWATINYRGVTQLDAQRTNTADAYRVVLSNGGLNIRLAYGTTILADSGVTWSDGDVVQVSFEGDNHIVKVNNTEVINFTETTAGRTGAGHVGMGVTYSWVHWDDYSVSAIPEPATLALLALGGLLTLARRRRR